MSYEVALFWSGLCGAIAIYFLWRFYNKRTKSIPRQKLPREVILEATTKRLSDIHNSTIKDGESSEELNSMDAKPLVEKQETENGSSKCEEKHPNDSLQHQASSIEEKGKAEVKRVYQVKVKNEGIVPGDLDPDTLLPISRPLKTLDEVYQWIPGFDHFNVASVPLRPVEREFPKKPKTLVCHDMKGGYIEDRFVQGYNSTQCYRITEWNWIDTFVYFSHNIVTIPPPCWTNTCHRHGVKVLGTFIVEWDEGNKICSQILESRESYQRFAKRLVEIACYYNFDGWLVNIETTISPDKIKDLIAFLGFLTQSMHKLKPSSDIIWYDSVTNEGELNWQNELNAKNSAFFDVCDGIFLNYTWSIHNLAHSSLVAGNQRKFDVYVGVDCFGRGCFGGGGWNTYKPMQLIREQNLSVAIFAPGWVYETQGEENFTKNQAKFFQLLMKYLYLHIIKQLPLASSFSQGYGNHCFSNGHKLMNLPWTNLSCKEFQPTFIDEYYKSGTRQGIEISDIFYCTDDAFEGGGCLKINGKLDSSAHDCRVFLRLFRCDCKLPSEFLVSYTVKMNHAKSAEVYLLLLLDRQPNYVMLSPLEIDGDLETKCDDGQHLVKVGDSLINASCKDTEKRSVPLAQEENYISFLPIFGESKSFIDKVCHNGNGQSNDWNTRYYLIKENNLPALKEMRLVCIPRKTNEDSVSQFSLLLGQVRVMSLEELVPCFPIIANIRCRDTNIQHSVDICILSTTIIWDKMFRPSIKDNPILHYDIFSNVSKTGGAVNHENGVFLGEAYVESFRVSNLKVEAHRTSVEICIRPVTEYGIKAARKHWGFVVVEW